MPGDGNVAAGSRRGLFKGPLLRPTVGSFCTYGARMKKSIRAGVARCTYDYRGPGIRACTHLHVWCPDEIGSYGRFFGG